MNIEEYRAMVKAEKEAEVNSTPTEPTPTPVATTTPTEPVKPVVTEENTPTETVTEPTPTQRATFKLGEEEIDVSQIEEWRKGYMRQDDYTRKTQELAKQRREARQAMEIVKQIQDKPELLEKVKDDVVQLNPVVAKMQQMEQELADIKVEREINYLTSKYTDIDMPTVLQYAVENDSNTLEDAYLALKNTQPTTPQTPTKPVGKEIDIESLRAEIRNDILKELEGSSIAPTIISTNSNTQVVQTNEPQLSETEKRVAKMNGLSDADYVKWRDKK